MNYCHTPSGVSSVVLKTGGNCSGYVVNVMMQIWDRESLECVQVLQGHTGSVLCLQYDENVIISGSSDATVRYELLPLYPW